MMYDMYIYIQGAAREKWQIYPEVRTIKQQTKSQAFLPVKVAESLI